jgi:hypothetical protein
VPGSGWGWLLIRASLSLYDAQTIGEREPQIPTQAEQLIQDAPGLPTVGDERQIPLPPDTLSLQERRSLGEAAEAIALDVTHSTPLPSAHDLFVAEPLHPAVATPDSQA